MMFLTYNLSLQKFLIYKIISYDMQLIAQKIEPKRPELLVKKISIGIIGSLDEKFCREDSRFTEQTFKMHTFLMKLKCIKLYRTRNSII